MLHYFLYFWLIKNVKFIEDINSLLNIFIKNWNGDNVINENNKEKQQNILFLISGLSPA